MANQYTGLTGPSPRQKQVYDYIYNHITRKGVCPSYDEIAAGVGMVKSNVTACINRMVDKGMIIKTGRRRGLVLRKVCCPHCGKYLKRSATNQGETSQ